MSNASVCGSPVGGTVAGQSPREKFLAELTEPAGGVGTPRAGASGARPVEAALRGSYRALYDNIPAMCFTLAASGEVLEVNARGTAELGYRREDLVGLSILEVFHPQDRPAVEERLRACLEDPTAEGVARWRLRKVRSDGTLLWVEEAARTVEENGRKVVLLVCEDVAAETGSRDRRTRYENELRALTSRLALAEERERRRMAEGLHDQIGQLLAMANLRLGTLLDSDSETRLRNLTDIRGLLKQALAETRSLTFELSCPVLYRLGLEEALRDLGERLSRQVGIRFRFESDSRPKPLAEDTQITLYRAVQELLFNIAKHAQAENARLEVARVEDLIRITVEDDGLGFDHSRIGDGPTPTGGFGLFGIRERLDHLGGSLEIETDPDRGTRIMASAPVIPEPSSDDPP